MSPRTCGDRSLDIYRRGRDHARSRGIILADTKFEWGRLPGGELILIDEVLTPDSSRFWPADSYRPGGSPPSFDKQFVRDWLETTGWDKNSPPPPLPADVVAQDAREVPRGAERLTGETFVADIRRIQRAVRPAVCANVARASAWEPTMRDSSVAIADHRRPSRRRRLRRRRHGGALSRRRATSSTWSA